MKKVFVSAFVGMTILSSSVMVSQGHSQNHNVQPSHMSQAGLYDYTHPRPIPGHNPSKFQKKDYWEPGGNADWKRKFRQKSQSSGKNSGEAK